MAHTCIGLEIHALTGALSSVEGGLPRGGPEVSVPVE